jgi:hypothetical protein
VYNCEKRGVTNADFVESVEQLVLEGRCFDLAHSCIVFNHIPWVRGREIITGLYELLNPGGVTAIQVLHRHKPGPLRRICDCARRTFAPFNWAANALQNRPLFEPLMQGNACPLDEMLPYLAALGVQESMFVRRRQGTVTILRLSSAENRGPMTPLDSRTTIPSIRLSLASE